MESKELNIYQKLVEVRKSIDGFKKDATGYGYKYVSGTQVLTSIKTKMDELGIILEPHLIHPVVEKSDRGYLADAEMKMVWVNADKPEDRIEIDWYMTGEQKDPSQAFGSGLTYSERYFLLKFFNVPTDEDDPDNPREFKNTKPINTHTENERNESNEEIDEELSELLDLAFTSEKMREAFLKSFEGDDERLKEVLKKRIKREVK